jgi:hypothetical protein
VTTTASDNSELSGDDFIRVAVEAARADKTQTFLDRLNPQPDHDNS